MEYRGVGGLKRWNLRYVMFRTKLDLVLSSKENIASYEYRLETEKHEMSSLAITLPILTTL